MENNNGDNLDLLKAEYEKAETHYLSCKEHVQDLLDRANSTSHDEMIDQALKIATEELIEAQKKLYELQNTLEALDVSDFNKPDVSDPDVSDPGFGDDDRG